MDNGNVMTVRTPENGILSTIGNILQGNILFPNTGFSIAFLTVCQARYSLFRVGTGTKRMRRRFSISRSSQAFAYVPSKVQGFLLSSRGKDSGTSEEKSAYTETLYTYNVNYSGGIVHFPSSNRSRRVYQRVNLRWQ